MSTVLVTGGAGYIGSHAVKALRAIVDQILVSVGEEGAAEPETMDTDDAEGSAEAEAAKVAELERLRAQMGALQLRISSLEGA